MINATDVVTKAKPAGSSVPAAEIDAALEKIFNSVSSAIRENDRKVTLESVDKTLNALFDAINNAPTEGRNIKLPDFKKILTEGN